MIWYKCDINDMKVHTLINWGVANLTVAIKQTLSSYEGRCDRWIVPSKPLCAELGTEGRQRRGQQRLQHRHGGEWQSHHKADGSVFIYCSFFRICHQRENCYREYMRIYTKEQQQQEHNHKENFSTKIT